jgi:type I restriction enzyme S subunit
MNQTQQFISDHINIWTTSEAEKKSRRGRYSDKAAKVYGIGKLRELILDLAISGKLIPQNHSDEPAIELLKRIKMNRHELAVGNNKKQKALTAAKEVDAPFKLPLGWQSAYLIDIAEIIRGVTYGKSDANNLPLNGSLPLLRANNIDGILNFDGLVHVPANLVKTNQLVKAGDIVIAMSSGSSNLVGKAAQAEKDFNGSFGAFCGVIRSLSPELFKYFGFFFQTPYYRKIVAGYGKGIGINNLQKSSLELLVVPIPPLAEQDRIVFKVDELMTLCDQLEQKHINSEEAHEKLVKVLLDSLTQSKDTEKFKDSWQRIDNHFDTLFTTEESIDDLKQILLQLAVTGKLVPQDPNDEPASEQIKRIHISKNNLIVSGRLKETKPPKNNKINAMVFKMPSGWEIVKLADLVNIINGRAYKKEELLSKGTPVLRVGNLFTSQSWFYSDLVLEESKYCEKGDLLFAWSASFGPFIWEGEKSIYHYHIWKLDLHNTDFLYKQYLYTFLLEQTKKIKSSGHGVMMIHMTKDAMEKLDIYLPPLAEQYRIVSKFNKLMALCDELKFRIQQASAKQKQLADALVSQALQWE